MLSHKELMLGNWVYESERSQFPMEVVNIDKDMVYLDFDSNEGDVFDGRMEDICPIPLTEKFFNKNNFEYLDGVYYLKQCSNTEFYNDDDGCFYMTSNLGEYKCIENPIKYVHQLQNILTIAGIDIDFKI